MYGEPCRSLAKSDAYFTSESAVKSQFGVAKVGSPDWAEQQKTFPLLTEIPKPTSASYCWILPKDEPEDDPETETILHVLEYPNVASAAAAAPGIIDGDPEAIGDEATVGAGDGWGAGSLRIDRVVLVLSVWDDMLNVIAAKSTVRSMLKDLVPTVLP